MPLLASCVFCLYGALNGADLASTEWGLAQGAREGNWLAQDKFSRVALKAASTLALTWTDSQLPPKTRPVFRAGIAAVFLGVVTNNIVQGIRAKNGRLQSS